MVSCSVVVAVALAFALTGDWRSALAVGFVEPIVGTVVYGLHERAFARFWPERGGGGAFCDRPEALFTLAAPV